MLCIFPFYSWGQGDLNDENKILFRDEISFSLGVNSNGLGFGSRYSKHIDYLHKSIYEFQFVTLHNPKEIKLSTSTGRTVYGKLNNAYSLLFTVGKQNQKYRKLDKGSVAIFFIYDGGIALGLEKPMYYYVEYPNQLLPNIERFNTSNHTKYGKAPFKYGLNEIKFIPGLYLKSCLNFEYSPRETEIKALEFGMSLQAYPRKINIMYSNENSWFFTTLFINYRIGKVIEK